MGLQNKDFDYDEERVSLAHYFPTYIAVLVGAAILANTVGLVYADTKRAEYVTVTIIPTFGKARNIKYPIPKIPTFSHP